MDQDQFEKSSAASLQDLRQSLGALESQLTATAQAMTDAATAPKRAPAQLKEILKLASTAMRESVEIVQDHADGSLRVSDGLLLEAARTIATADEVLNAIILVEAVRPLTR